MANYCIAYQRQKYPTLVPEAKTINYQISLCTYRLQKLSIQDHISPTLVLRCYNIQGLSSVLLLLWFTLQLTPNLCYREIWYPRYYTTRLFGRERSLYCFVWLRYSVLFIRAKVHSQAIAVKRGRGCVTLGAVQENMASRD